MDKVLLVFLGGGIGSVLRYLLQLWLNAAPADGRPGWPWGTLAANVVGSAAAGAVAGLASTRLALDEHARLVLSVGLLGGFTTFSAMAGETVAIGGAAPGRALGYVAATNALSIAAACVAYALVRTSPFFRST
jgi:CrcB protein